MSLPHEINPLIPPPQKDEDPIELSNMIAGRMYQDYDKYIVRVRTEAAYKLGEINKVVDPVKRMALWRGFANFGDAGDVFITKGLFCEYVSTTDHLFLLPLCASRLGDGTITASADDRGSIYTLQVPIL